jgi:hypothetical protein
MSPIYDCVVDELEGYPISFDIKKKKILIIKILNFINVFNLISIVSAEEIAHFQEKMLCIFDLLL